MLLTPCLKIKSKKKQPYAPQSATADKKISELFRFEREHFIPIIYITNSRQYFTNYYIMTSNQAPANWKQLIKPYKSYLTAAYPAPKDAKPQTKASYWSMKAKKSDFNWINGEPIPRIRADMATSIERMLKPMTYAEAMKKRQAGDTMKVKVLIRSERIATAAELEEGKDIKFSNLLNGSVKTNEIHVGLAINSDSDKVMLKDLMKITKAWVARMKSEEKDWDEEGRPQQHRFKQFLKQYGEIHDWLMLKGCPPIINGTGSSAAQIWWVDPSSAKAHLRPKKASRAGPAYNHPATNCAIAAIKDAMLPIDAKQEKIFSMLESKYQMGVWPDDYDQIARKLGRNIQITFAPSSKVAKTWVESGHKTENEVFASFGIKSKKKIHLHHWGNHATAMTQKPEYEYKYVTKAEMAEATLERYEQIYQVGESHVTFRNKLDGVYETLQLEEIDGVKLELGQTSPQSQLYDEFKSQIVPFNYNDPNRESYDQFAKHGIHYSVGGESKSDYDFDLKNAYSSYTKLPHYRGLPRDITYWINNPTIEQVKSNSGFVLTTFDDPIKNCEITAWLACCAVDFLYDNGFIIEMTQAAFAHKTFELDTSKFIDHDPEIIEDGDRIIEVPKIGKRVFHKLLGLSTMLKAKKRFISADFVETFGENVAQLRVPSFIEDDEDVKKALTNHVSIGVTYELKTKRYSHIAATIQDCITTELWRKWVEVKATNPNAKIVTALVDGLRIACAGMNKNTFKFDNGRWVQKPIKGCVTFAQCDWISKPPTKAIIAADILTRVDYPITVKDTFRSMLSTGDLSFADLSDEGYINSIQGFAGAGKSYKVRQMLEQFNAVILTPTHSTREDMESYSIREYTVIGSLTKKLDEAKSALSWLKIKGDDCTYQQLLIDSIQYKIANFTKLDKLKNELTKLDKISKLKDEIVSLCDFDVLKSVLMEIRDRATTESTNIRANLIDATRSELETFNRFEMIEFDLMRLDQLSSIKNAFTKIDKINVDLAKFEEFDSITNELVALSGLDSVQNELAELTKFSLIMSELVAFNRIRDLSLISRRFKTAGVYKFGNEMTSLDKFISITDDIVKLGQLDLIKNVIAELVALNSIKDNLVELDDDVLTSIPVKTYQSVIQRPALIEDYQVIIVDEAGMLLAEHLNRIVEISGRKLIVLVGDPAQHKPIIASKLHLEAKYLTYKEHINANEELKEIYENGSDWERNNMLSQLNYDCTFIEPERDEKDSDEEHFDKTEAARELYVNGMHDRVNKLRKLMSQVFKYTTARDIPAFDTYEGGLLLDVVRRADDTEDGRALVKLCADVREHGIKAVMDHCDANPSAHVLPNDEDMKIIVADVDTTTTISFLNDNVDHYNEQFTDALAERSNKAKTIEIRKSLEAIIKDEFASELAKKEATEKLKYAIADVDIRIIATATIATKTESGEPVTIYNGTKGVINNFMIKFDGYDIEIPLTEISTPTRASKRNPFKRPVLKICAIRAMYGITSYRAQGRTMADGLIYVDCSYLTYEMLYVAVSRATKLSQLRFIYCDTEVDEKGNQIGGPVYHKEKVNKYKFDCIATDELNFGFKTTNAEILMVNQCDNIWYDWTNFDWFAAIDVVNSQYKIQLEAFQAAIKANPEFKGRCPSWSDVAKQVFPQIYAAHFNITKATLRYRRHDRVFDDLYDSIEELTPPISAKFDDDEEDEDIDYVDEDINYVDEYENIDYDLIRDVDEDMLEIEYENLLWELHCKTLVELKAKTKLI